MDAAVGLIARTRSEIDAVAAWAADPASWWRSQEVNVLGALHAVHAFVLGMVARGRGRP